MGTEVEASAAQAFRVTEVGSRARPGGGGELGTGLGLANLPPNA